MVASFVRVWQRPPTEQELKGLVDDHVREEIASRLGSVVRVRVLAGVSENT
jgi:hypothetical protein